MKKCLSLLLVVLLACGLAACSSQSQPEANIEGDLSEIMEKLIATVEVDDETREYILGRLAYTQLNEENSEYYLGKADYSYLEGYAAEPMVNAQAFSLVLLRGENADQAKTLAEQVKETANPQKWICVGVDPSDVQTASVGDLALLVMADNSENYIAAFEALAGQAKG